MKNPFKALNKFDWALWIGSLVIITVIFAAASKRDYMTLAASLIGITAGMFTAKGHVLGQILIVVFAVFYGIISYFLKYYGEMITYLGMSAPVAVASVVTWIKHPHEDGAEVKVATMSTTAIIAVAALTAVVTTAFYFILRALGTANLAVGTVSVATSFLASAFSVLRSPLYAVSYALNDIVLIVLWVLATVTDISNLPMVICFSLFLLHDIYGFVNWKRMKKSQANNEKRA